MLDHFSPESANESLGKGLRCSTVHWSIFQRVEGDGYFQRIRRLSQPRIVQCSHSLDFASYVKQDPFAPKALVAPVWVPRLVRELIFKRRNSSPGRRYGHSLYLDCRRLTSDLLIAAHFG